MALLGVERPEAAIAPTGVPIAECPECPEYPVAYIAGHSVLALLDFVEVVAIVVGFAAVVPASVEKGPVE